MRRRIIVLTAAAIFAAALVFHFRELGGPYFARPQTIQDHVAVRPWPSRDAIVMSRRAATLVPRGATITVIMPSQAPNYDPTLVFVGAGLLPHHRMTSADLNERPQYVIAVRDALSDPAYRLQHQFLEGSIYIRR
jgi:hypothetical protein